MMPAPTGRGVPRTEGLMRIRSHLAEALRIADLLGADLLAAHLVQAQDRVDRDLRDEVAGR